MLVAPSEPSKLKKLGEASLAPERYGVDFYWVARGKKWGVQRKAISDFVASQDDGRLSTDIAKMAALYQGFLLIEGEWKWTMDGVWMEDHRSKQKLTHGSLQSYLLTIQSRGVYLLSSRNLDDSFNVISRTADWSMKEKHTSLSIRPGPVPVWGTSPGNRDWQVHMLCGLPGVGPELAGRILDTIGMPLSLGVPMGVLMTIPGIGKKKAEAICRVLGSTD